MQLTHATTLIQPADRELQAINPDPRLDDPAIRLKHAIDFDPDEAQAAAIIDKVGSPDQSLRSVSLYFGITLEALTLWLDRPEITRRLDAIRTCQLRRAQLAAANYLPGLIPVLSDLINASAYDHRAPIPCTDLKGREFLRRSRNTSLKAIHLITKIAQTPIRAIGSPHVSKGPASQPRSTDTSDASAPQPLTSPSAHPITCSAPRPLASSAAPPDSPPTRPRDHERGSRKLGPVHLPRGSSSRRRCADTVARD